MIDLSKFTITVTKTYTFSFSEEIGEECLEAFNDYVHDWYSEEELSTLTEAEWKILLRSFVYDNDDYIEQQFIEDVEMEVDVWKQGK